MKRDSFMKSGLSSLQQKLNRNLLDALEKDFRRHLKALQLTSKNEKDKMSLLLDYLKESILSELNVLELMEVEYNRFTSDYSRALSHPERQAYILQYALMLHRSKRKLKKDREAMKRWFGYDTVVERYHREKSKKEQKISFWLERTGSMFAFSQSEMAGSGGEIFVQKWDIGLFFDKIFVPRADPRLKVALLKCWGNMLKTIQPEYQNEFIPEEFLKKIMKAAMDQFEPVWVQCAAFSIIQDTGLGTWHQLALERFKNPRSGDDIFVRQHILKNMRYSPQFRAQAEHLISMAHNDSSEFVRQAVFSGLATFPFDLQETNFQKIMGLDPSPKVRSSTLLTLFKVLHELDDHLSFHRILESCMRSEKDPLVIKTLLNMINVQCKACASSDPEKNQASLGYWSSLVHTIAKADPPPQLQKMISETQENLWVNRDSRACELRDKLIQILGNLPPGQSRKVKKSDLAGFEENLIGRVMAMLCQEDFGVQIQKGMFFYIFFKGPRFRFKFWRFFHEILNPSPDKREGFSHTKGRTPLGAYRIPSGILSELTETKVPGEPLYFEEEDGNRAFLPLLDDFLSLVHPLSNLKEFKTFSSAGITHVHQPVSFLKQMYAYMKINLRFSKIADLRNWDARDTASPDSYIKTMQEMGFRVSFQPYACDFESEEPIVKKTLVAKFFPSLGAMILPDLALKFRDYAISLYENSFFELVVFTGIALCVFSSRHLWSNWRFRRARNKIPVSFGGWGTRGKSGTERLKAALMNAEGYGLVSKTTGCEAMFLHGDPFGEMYELLLFRPYDKATIWEQQSLVIMAEQFGADMVLWECMALQPPFVHIMQRQWMKDDIATLTNAYPDHEDIMGPAGINIPDVMACFIPKNSTLLTTEHQMNPVFRYRAKLNHTHFVPVDGIQAELISDDVLKRFPYNEHPSNIALVQAFALELGIDPDYAIKEMADRVIADIGMLKTFPVSMVYHRRLEFSNGMSANEKLGCLGNWKRLGFDQIDFEREYDTVISVVVNNRADRIPRSKVFADILVNDIRVDFIFLIGNNLNGLEGYIRKSWDENVHNYSLIGSDDSTESRLSRLTSICRQFRIPFSEEHVVNRLGSMIRPFVAEAPPREMLLEMLYSADASGPLGNLIPELQDKETIISDMLEALVIEKKKLEQFKVLSGKTGVLEKADLDKAFHQQLWDWFSSRITVIHDYHASGDRIIHEIAKKTPPGHLNRILGVQNIKGTGMDFVLRWLAWETCHRANQLLLSGKKNDVANGLSLLARFMDHGLLSHQTLSQTLANLKKAQTVQNEQAQAQLIIIDANMNQAMKKVDDQIHKVEKKQGFMKGVIDWFEGFLDIGDAVRRKKIANLIYKDLVHERISHERAASELFKLHKKQKGGWLFDRIVSVQNRLIDRRK